MIISPMPHTDEAMLRWLSWHASQGEVIAHELMYRFNELLINASRLNNLPPLSEKAGEAVKRICNED